ncbi:hypothetical protein HNP33_003714 [Comamonas odontotermitis]|uniref:Uncharacterized protein n=1 Tax=Comamonas odontotermitis TaxID=379895 RepID=A0ABR6RK88_9BURK|nr:hypothetical protein [Comamonas odontotermitis]MBB6579600.1 hypothetical protein [Comamonas odontotermitis]
MPELTALKRFTYAGKALVAGAGFVASRQDARVLVAVRNARYATVTPVIEQKSPDNDLAVAGDEAPTPAPKKMGRPKKA